jgi:hypothetical protein
VTVGRYRIVLRGRLSERLASAFDGMTLEPGPGQTILVGEVRDQAHMYGLLDQLRDFGIDLLAVQPVGTSDGSPGAGTLDPARARTAAQGPSGRERARRRVPPLVVERRQGFPVTGGEREDPGAAHAAGGAVLDLARRQGRVPVADGGEVSLLRVLFHIR